MRLSHLILIAGLYLSAAGGVSAALPLQDSQGESLPSLAPMLEQVNPAVVNIATYSTRRVVNPLLNDPFFRRFFNIHQDQLRPQQRRSQNSAGSGVIVDAKAGTIVTNYHVVQGADEVQISLTDGRSYQARLVGADPEVDIAVLDIDADGLTQMSIRDSDQLRVGDFVVAIGNPFGLGQTITTGVVSALGRSGLGIEGYENFIQTDASINPGNSGGALVDLNGDLIGINTAIIAPGGGNVGIGFAIPSNMMRQVADQILDSGNVSRGQIGITTQDVTPDLRRAFKLENGQSGVLITGVQRGSAADRAGLRAGDMVISIDGKATSEVTQLRNRIAFAPVDRDIELKVLRQGQIQSVKLRVSREAKQVSDRALHAKLEGARFLNGTNDQGVLISSIEQGSPASRAGLMQGDVVLSVNRRSVHSVSELKSILRGSRSDLLLQVKRDRQLFYLVIR